MNDYPYITILIAVAAIGLAAAIRFFPIICSIFSRSIPPLIGDDGENIQERFDKAIKQQHDASVELQEVVRDVLKENDRLRRRRRNTTHA